MNNFFALDFNQFFLEKFSVVLSCNFKNQDNEKIVSIIQFAFWYYF